jgi:hypothetical protein
MSTLQKDMIIFDALKVAIVNVCLKYLLIWECLNYLNNPNLFQNKRSINYMQKLSNIFRVFILLSVMWFAGYVSATTVCASTCPDCVSVSINSCSASCSAVGVPSYAVVKVKLPKPVFQGAELPLIYVSVNTANIWKPPKQAVPSLFHFLI